MRTADTGGSHRAPEDHPMSKLPLWFLATAAACLVVGVCMGVAMGIAHDFHLAPVHGHLNLVGWTSLSLMGLTYRAYPKLMARRASAIAQYVLSAGSAMAFPFGIFLSIEHQAPALAIGAALVWLAGAVLFLARLLMLALGRGTPSTAAAPKPALMAAE
jgi:hypothetical protein